MPPSRRTGVSRPVASHAPSAPSIPQSSRPMAAAPPPPAPRPPPPAYGAAPPPGHHAPAAAAHHAPPPAMAPAGMAPMMAPAAPAGGGMLSGIMGSVVTGMAMGTGSAIAHRAVDGMMGPRQVEHVHTPAPAAAPAAAPTTGWFGSSAPAAPAGQTCGNETQMFQDCIKNTGGDIAPCQSYMDMMMKCRQQFPGA